jgi:serine/threonine protein kinase
VVPGLDTPDGPDPSEKAMADPDPRTSPERPSETRPLQPVVAAAPASDPGGSDPPTVRTGAGSTGSGPGAPIGSSYSRGPLGDVEPMPRPGDRLGVFALQEAIGAGGMGAVFRAHDDQLDRAVALKVLPPEHARDPEAVSRFYQEGRAAARLDHENIARVYTIGQAGPHHYIAFEFIEGMTIRQRVEGGGVLPVADAINYTLQIASALVHAAERGVVHRDVKPSNIIVTPQGRAKLVDMGLARRFERGGDAGLTQTGMTLGTFDYISPEQARDPRDVDVRSDLYSLGCTLYYMLAGRPPFPDGTVLQKLIQHQEEPPPDVRAANPAVPADLASTVLKLMAKDRERRYQSPEALVRDLLLVAGAHNIRSVSPEGLVWSDAAPPPAWERHLVWGVPALAFAVIAAFLAWGGAGPEPAPQASLPAETIQSPRAAKSATPPAPVSSRSEEAPPAKAVPPERAASRDVTVHSTDDLGRLMAEAAPGTTLLLADDGPYDLRFGLAPLSPRDLTVRAGVGVQPVVRLARDGEAIRPAPALLDLRGGRLVIDGLDFKVDSDDRDAPLAAVRAEGTELSLARCSFRRVGSRPGRGQTSGLHLRATAEEPGARGAAEVVVDSCHFDAGQFAIVADGPVDLTIRDATIGPARIAAIESRNPTARPAVIRVEHASVLLGAGPLLRASGVPPAIRLADAAVAPVGEGEGVLVVADDPGRLDWRGRDNLYGRIGTYLQAGRGAAAGFAAVRSFDAWADDPSSVREANSTTSVARIWADPDPTLLAGSSSNPSLAFRLASVRGGIGRVGARRGPLGVLAAAAPARPAPEAGARLSVGATTGGSARPRTTAVGPVARADVPTPTAGPSPSRPSGEAAPAKTVGTEAPPMPMPVKPPADAEEPFPEMPIMPTAEPEPAPRQPAPRPAVANNPAPPPAGPREADPPPIRTAAQLVGALAQAGGRGGETLRLASDADLEMSSCQLKGMGSWTLRAEPGKTRPRIRFRPRLGEARTPGSWLAWLTLISGSLHVEGIDLILPRDDAPRTGGWAAFAVGAGTDLSVSNCTVTIEGSEAKSAVVVAPPAEGRGFDDVEPEAPTTTLRLKESLFRAGGDLVDVAGDRRIDLQVDDAVVATTKALLHAHGRSRGLPAEPLKATLRRLVARTEGGLVLLEGTADDPELPLTEVVARDSAFTTDGRDTPLIQVEGGDDPEALRDRVRWDGHGVAYQRISNYRRDQTLRPGALPTTFNRESWDTAVGRRDTAPIHDDTIFAAEWPTRRPVWEARPDDFRLRPDGPADRAGAGPDRASIPAPPARS